MNRFSYIVIFLFCLPCMVFAQEQDKTVPAAGTYFNFI